MIPFTKATWRAMGIPVFMFKEMGRNVMDVGSFTRVEGTRNSCSFPWLLMMLSYKVLISMDMKVDKSIYISYLIQYICTVYSVHSLIVLCLFPYLVISKLDF